MTSAENDWTIRTAVKEDLPELTEIYNEAVSAGFQTADTQPFTVQEREKWFAAHQSNFPVYVILADQQVAGYCSLSSYRNGRAALKFTAEISYYIRSSRQGKGMGYQLLQFTVQQALKLGFKTLIAIVLDRNLPSIRLLEKCGFAQWGALPGVADFNGTECGHLYFGRRIQS